MQTNVYVNSVQFYLQNKKHFDGKKDNDGVGHPFLSFKSPSSSSVLLVSVIYPFPSLFLSSTNSSYVNISLVSGVCDLGDSMSLAVKVSCSSDAPRDSDSHSVSEPPLTSSYVSQVSRRRMSHGLTIGNSTRPQNLIGI